MPVARVMRHSLKPLVVSLSSACHPASSGRAGLHFRKNKVKSILFGKNEKILLVAKKVKIHFSRNNKSLYYIPVFDNSVMEEVIECYQLTMFWE